VTIPCSAKQLRLDDRKVYFTANPITNPDTKPDRACNGIRVDKEHR
jgi:hypothetical protein